MNNYLPFRDALASSFDLLGEHDCTQVPSILGHLNSLLEVSNSINEQSNESECNKESDHASPSLKKCFAGLSLLPTPALNEHLIAEGWGGFCFLILVAYHSQNRINKRPR